MRGVRSSRCSARRTPPSQIIIMINLRESVCVCVSVASSYLGHAINHATGLTPSREEKRERKGVKKKRRTEIVLSITVVCRELPGALEELLIAIWEFRRCLGRYAMDHESVRTVTSRNSFVTNRDS